MDRIAMTARSPFFGRNAVVEGWSDEPGLTKQEINYIADLEIAYMVNEIGKVLRGWEFASAQATFRGPYIDGTVDPIAKIMQLKMKIVDRIVENLFEIRKEFALKRGMGVGRVPNGGTWYATCKQCGGDVSPGGQSTERDAWHVAFKHQH